MAAWVDKIIRPILAHAGYIFLKRDFIRFGYSPFSDIKKISATWGWPTEVVFDVGANAGQFAKEALKEFRFATVHSFEPHPIVCGRFQREINDRRSVLHQLALGPESGEVPLYVYGSEGGGSFINSLTPEAGFPQKFGYRSRQIKVPCGTIDGFCRQRGLERIDLLKVDTEGFDLNVLRGAENMFREGRIRFVYVEFNSLFSKQGVTGGALFPIAEFLTKFGLTYVCTYTDFVFIEQKLWVCANALFVAPPPEAV